MASEYIRNPKDYVLKEMKLVAYNGKEYDISALRGSLKLFEDIFGTPMTGSLDITDTMDLTHLLPFIGEEQLKVIFTKQDPSGKLATLDDVVLQFDVYKISDRTVMGRKAQQYTLHLLSRETSNAYKTKIFRSWKSVPYSTMAQQVYDQYIKHTKSLIIEPTSGEYNICMGNKNPYDFINFVAARSTPSGSTKGKLHMPPYLFYESKENFHFVSLDSLILQEPKEVYIRKPSNMRDPQSLDKMIDKDIRNIESIDWVGSYDVQRLLDMGFYGQELIAINPISRTFNRKEFKISQDWDRFNKLEAEKVFSNNSNLLDATLSHRKVMFTNQGIESLNPEEKSWGLENYVLDRTARLAQMFHTRFAMSVPGDPRRKLGEVIKIELPEEAGDIGSNREERYNRYYYGNYIIISLSHHISFSSYTIDMEVARDSFWQPIEHEDPLARYKDSI